MSEKEFKVTAKISGINPSAIVTVLERIIGNNESIKPTNGGVEVNTEFKGKALET